MSCALPFRVCCRVKSAYIVYGETVSIPRRQIDFTVYCETKIQSKTRFSLQISDFRFQISNASWSMLDASSELLVLSLIEVYHIAINPFPCYIITETPTTDHIIFQACKNFLSAFFFLLVNLSIVFAHSSRVASCVVKKRIETRPA